MKIHRRALHRRALHRRALHRGSGVLTSWVHHIQRKGLLWSVYLVQGVRVPLRGLSIPLWRVPLPLTLLRGKGVMDFLLSEPT